MDAKPAARPSASALPCLTRKPNRIAREYGTGVLQIARNPCAQTIPPHRSRLADSFGQPPGRQQQSAVYRAVLLNLRPTTTSDRYGDRYLATAASRRRS